MKWLIRYKIFAKIRDFGENPRFLRKSEIFAKIQDFRKNPRFSQKSEIFAKIRGFRKNLRFSQKICDFRQNQRFSKKSEIKKIKNFYDDEIVNDIIDIFDIETYSNKNIYLKCFKCEKEVYI